MSGKAIVDLTMSIVLGTVFVALCIVIYRGTSHD